MWRGPVYNALLCGRDKYTFLVPSLHAADAATGIITNIQVTQATVTCHTICPQAMLSASKPGPELDQTELQYSLLILQFDVVCERCGGGPHWEIHLVWKDIWSPVLPGGDQPDIAHASGAVAINLIANPRMIRAVLEVRTLTLLEAPGPDKR